jgi:tRNA(Ile)-lysidine synthase
MNDDEDYARVHVRKQVIPLLEKLNPKSVENITRASFLFREDAAALGAEAELLLASAKVPNAAGQSGDVSSAVAEIPAALDVQTLLAAPSAVRRRALRLWLAGLRGSLLRMERVHLLAVDRLLSPGRGGRVAQLPGGGSVERRGGLLVFKV